MLEAKIKRRKENIKKIKVIQETLEALNGGIVYYVGLNAYVDVHFTDERYSDMLEYCLLCGLERLSRESLELQETSKQIEP